MTFFCKWHHIFWWRWSWWSSILGHLLTIHCRLSTIDGLVLMDLDFHSWWRGYYWWIWTMKIWQSKSWWCRCWWFTMVGHLLTVYCRLSTIDDLVLMDLVCQMLTDHIVMVAMLIVRCGWSSFYSSLLAINYWWSTVDVDGSLWLVISWQSTVGHQLLMV